MRLWMIEGRELKRSVPGRAWPCVGLGKILHSHIHRLIVVFSLFLLVVASAIFSGNSVRAQEEASVTTESTEATDVKAADVSEPPSSENIPYGEIPGMSDWELHELLSEAEPVEAPSVSLDSLNQPLMCTAKNFYALGIDGNVFEFFNNGSSIEKRKHSFIFNRAPGAANNPANQVNSLGIGYGGKEAFALDKIGNGYAFTHIDILKWTAESGPLQSPVRSGVKLRGKDGLLFDMGKIVAGAMKPVQGSTDFYFAGFHNEESYTAEGTVNSTFFNIWKYNSTYGTVSYLGYSLVDREVKKPEKIYQGGNGDMGFDGSGNLHILFDDKNKNVRIIPMSITELEKAEKNVDETSDDFESNKTWEILSENPNRLSDLSNSNVINGIAFDRDGSVYVEASNGIYSVDTTTGKRLGPSVRNDFFGGDLASCTTFSTIELHKDVESRVREDDQFTLEIVSEEKTEPVASMTTEGAETGLDKGQAGPVPTSARTKYKLREKAANGFELKGYSAELTCEEKRTQTSVAAVKTSDFEYEVEIPDYGDVAEVSCTFKNTANVGSLEWTKTSEDPTELLGGSTWVLKGPEDAQFTVEDNVGQEGYTGRDADPKPGQFKVKNLILGAWALSETKAPQGYRVIDSKVWDASLIEDNKDRNLGKIQNYPVVIRWQKVDDSEEKKLLGGSEWNLSYGEKTLAITDCVAEKPEDCVGPDKDPEMGKFLVTKFMDNPILDGTYTLTETKAPEGYEKTSEPFSIEIAEKEYKVAGKATSLSFDKEAKVFPVNVGEITNKRAVGTLSWSKIDAQRDEAGNPVYLGGSEWTLEPIEGTPGETLKIVDKTDTFQGENDINAESGKLEVEKLPLGTYLLSEVKAPEGYVVGESSKKIVVKLDKDLTLDPVENRRAVGTVTWSKTDASEKKALLSGSEWELVQVDKEGGAPISDPLTIKDCDSPDCAEMLDKDPQAGEFEIGELPLGWYRLTETRSPVGYLLDQQPRYFQVAQDGATTAVGSIKNELGKGVELPLTGGLGELVFRVSGVLLAAISIIAWLVHLRRRYAAA